MVTVFNLLTGAKYYYQNIDPKLALKQTISQKAWWDNKESLRLEKEIQANTYTYGLGDFSVFKDGRDF